MTFHEHLTRRRKALGLSQEELAAKIGVSRQAVSKWETGDVVPDLNRLLALAEALNTSLDALCGREAAEPPAAAAPWGAGGPAEKAPLAAARPLRLSGGLPADGRAVDLDMAERGPGGDGAGGQHPAGHLYRLRGGVFRRVR